MFWWGYLAGFFTPTLVSGGLIGFLAWQDKKEKALRELSRRTRPGTIRKYDA